MWQRLLSLLALLMAGTLAVVPAPGQQAAQVIAPIALPATMNTPAAAVRAALADVQTLDPAVRPYVRYLWAADNLTAEQLKAANQTIAFAVNSLSRNSLIVLPAQVNPRLWRVILTDYHISPKAWDDIGKLGSGRTPFPEPYFHLLIRKEITETKKVKKTWAGGNDSKGNYFPAGYEYEAEEAVTKKTAVLAQAPWLPTLEISQLVAETHSEFPVYRVDHWAYNAFLEPRYHELLGLDDSVNSFKKLAAVDEKLADRVSSTIRGVTLESEVAEHNRILERTPTVARFGRGYFWASYDYETSIKGDNVVDDPLNDEPAAQELIASLPNGLQVYLVVDGKGKRLDRAAIEVARDKRNRFSSPEVEIRNCICCHSGGMVPFTDHIRVSARDDVAQGLRLLKEKDAVKAKKVVDRYFATDLDQWVTADAASYDAVVKSVNGLAAAANGLQFENFLVRYEQPLTLEALAAETGYPVAFVRGVIERSQGSLLDSSVVVLAKVKPRRARRDQIEANGFGSLMQLLIVGGIR